MDTFTQHMKTTGNRMQEGDKMSMTSSSDGARQWSATYSIESRMMENFRNSGQKTKSIGENDTGQCRG